MKALPFVLLAPLIACAAAGTNEARSASMTSGQEETPLEEAYQGVSSSVVTIFTVGRTGVVDAEGLAVTEQGVGSGVLVSEDGRILTAAHVVQTADQLMVEFHDGTRMGAETHGTSVEADVALVRLSGKPPVTATVAKLGDSNDVRVASRAFVVGAPLGISQTLTVGHVSAKRSRTGMGGALKVDLIQTDAAINKGNSGGPLFNMDGEVIGIVSHIVSETGGSDGLGFAIASNTAKSLLLDRHPVWSGVNWVMLAGPYAKAFNLPGGKPGMLLQTVAKDSPGERLGLIGGSIPAQIDGQDILLGGDVVIEVLGVAYADEASAGKIMKRWQSMRSGDVCRLKVFRQGEVIELSEKVDIIMPWLVTGD